MVVTSLKEQFGNYLYNRLPKVYRDYDVEIERVEKDDDGNNVVKKYKTLQEYLQAFALGGFQPLFEDIEAIISLIDPLTCPEQFLPIMLQHFGLDYVEGIPIKFQRRLLQNYVILYRKKGTLPAIVFLARELSGFNVKVEETEDSGVSHVLIRLDAYDDEQAELLLAQSVIQRYIHLFLPVTVQSEIVVTYGYAEGIHVNSSISYPETADHVKYDIEEDYSTSNIWDMITEESDVLQRCVDNDFLNIRIINGAGLNDEFSFYPFDTTSLTNTLETGVDFVYTNGICVEDSIITELEFDSGDNLIVEGLSSAIAEIKHIKADYYDGIMPIYKLTSTIRAGTILEFAYDDTVYGYLNLEFDLYSSEKFPTTFQLDIQNRIVRIYNLYFTATINENCVIRQREGYVSFYTLLKNYPANVLRHNSVDSLFMSGNVIPVYSDRCLYGSGSSGQFYIYILDGVVYMSCKDTVTNVKQMKQFLKNNPLTITVPASYKRLFWNNDEWSAGGYTISMKYLSKVPPHSGSVTRINCNIITLNDRQSAFAFENRYVSESSCIRVKNIFGAEKVWDLGVSLRGLDRYYDYIEKIGSKYYIHNVIKEYGVEDFLNSFNNIAEISRPNGESSKSWFTLSPSDCPLISNSDFSKKYSCINFLPCKGMPYSNCPSTENIDGRYYPLANSQDIFDFMFHTTSVGRTDIQVNYGNAFGSSGVEAERSVFQPYMWENCFRYSDIKPVFLFVGNEDVIEITDKTVINKLNLLPIPDEYAIISSRGISVSDVRLTVKSKIYN